MPDLSPQFDQLAMFHQAKDFVGNKKSAGKFYPMDEEAYAPRGGMNSFEVMWKEKIDEAHQPGPLGKPSLAESIKQHGIKQPIEVFHHDDDAERRNPFDAHERGYNQPAIWNGHHRAIVAHELHGPTAEVPVEHMDMYNEGWGAPKPSPKMLSGYRPPKKSR